MKTGPVQNRTKVSTETGAVQFRGLPDERTDPRIFSLDPETDRWEIQTSEDERFAKYRDALRSYKHTSGTKLAEGLGVNKSTVSRALEQMKADGVMTAEEISICYNTAKNLNKTDDELAADLGAGEESEDF